MESQTTKPESVEVESDLMRPNGNDGDNCDNSKSQPYHNAKTISDTDSKQQQQQSKRNSRKKKKRRRLTNKDTDHIIIIGSGLAGLSCALSFEQEGYTNISLYERDINFDVQKEGYGLTISYNPTSKGPLCKLNLLEQVAQNDCPSRSHYIFRPDGTIVGYFGNAFYRYRDGYGQRGNLRVPRKVLRHILMENLKSTKVYWGYKFLDFIEEEKEVKVGDSDDSDDIKIVAQFEVAQSPTTANGSTESSGTNTVTTVQGDLLVAADGIRSAVVQALYKKHDQHSQRKRKQRPTSPPQVQQNGNGDKSNTSTKNERDHADTPAFNNTGLRPMHVRLVLGITEGFNHALLNERGFYTLDGKHRLFTMPFETDKWNTTEEGNSKKNRIMWQLSYGLDSDKDGIDTKSTSPVSPIFTDSKLLKERVLSICQTWHDPIQSMIESTPLGSIWGTDLMDRDPNELLQVLTDLSSDGSQSSLSTSASRVVIVGDALHPMSPFKGMGANQSLTDGPLLASWLQRGSVDAAIKGFMRQTVQRTGPIVQASRQAAYDFHHNYNDHSSHEEPTTTSNDRTSTLDESQHQSFAGVRPECVSTFLSILQQQCITANLGSKLDDTISNLIDELNDEVRVKEEAGDFNPDTPNTEEGSRRQSKHDLLALQYARDGNTQGLRVLSLQKHLSSIRCAKDVDTGRTCLHWAVLNGHVETCKWLLSEVLPPCTTIINSVDSNNQTPFDVAKSMNHTKIIQIFECMKRYEERNKNV